MSNESELDIEDQIIQKLNQWLPFRIRYYIPDNLEKIHNTTALVLKFRFLNHSLQWLMEYPLGSKKYLIDSAYLSKLDISDLITFDFNNLLMAINIPNQWIPCSSVLSPALCMPEKH